MKTPYCILPWVHIHTRPNGNVMPCCVYNINSPLGNVNFNTIDEIANSKEFNNLRKLLLDHTPPKECFECVSKQTSTLETSSYRYWRMQEFKDSFEELIENTNSDGSLKSKFTMKFMNIRYSNLCNMSCRTCGSNNSSVWAQEQNFQNPVIKITDTYPNYLKDVLERLDEVEVINFAGGESILIPEHWTVLDKLIELKKYNVKISYVTNLSKLSYQHKNILDYTKQLPNLMLRVSIDASHTRAEYYRNGTNWNTIEENLKILYSNNVNMKINCTVGATNVWHVPDLQKYLIESNLIKPEQFSMNILIQSPVHSTKILPQYFKESVIEKIQTHKVWLNANNIDSSQWDNVISFMLSEDHTHLLDNYIRWNLKIDKIRNQNILDCFPELSTIFNGLP